MTVTTLLVVVCALLLDALLGEPRRWHPLVGFGRVAHRLEQRLNRAPTLRIRTCLAGFTSMSLLILVPLLLTLSVANLLEDVSTHARSLFEVGIVYWAIGHQSLRQHVLVVYDALKRDNLTEARSAIGMIVSRDTQQLAPHQISAAAIETTLENGNDAVFGVIFWYLLGGLPMVVVYRLSNTLDAMWGYRTTRFEWFGKPAALLDDLLNFIPARLVALSYALLGNYQTAITSWRRFAPLLPSPNAGPVMTAGAGSLDLQLGGATRYHNSPVSKPEFGGTKQPQPDDIPRALALVTGTLRLWLAVIALLVVAATLLSRGF